LVLEGIPSFLISPRESRKKHASLILCPWGYGKSFHATYKETLPIGMSEEFPCYKLAHMLVGRVSMLPTLPTCLREEFPSHMLVGWCCMGSRDIAINVHGINGFRWVCSKTKFWRDH
jgi:hypothetical protein